jgi:putative membrane protein
LCSPQINSASRDVRSDAAFAPPADAILRIRGYLWAEAALFLLLPVFAATMARGYGELTP